MSRFPVSVPRGDRHPPLVGAVNLMVVSDPQFVAYAAAAHQPYKAQADLNAMTSRASIAAWLFPGDLTNNATEAQYVEFDAWLAGVDTGTAPLALVPGNHDLIGSLGSGGVADVMTPAQWAARMSGHGVTGRDYVLDIPGTDLRVLCVSPMDSNPASPPAQRLTLDATTLAWCDARMAETERRCIIMFHAPLMNTVLSQPGVPYTSAYTTAATNWYVRSADTYTVEQMVASHPNLVAWISGHLHSQMAAPDIVKRNVTASGVFASISAGSPLTLPLGSEPAIVSTMVSIYPDRIEVRYRDHGAGQWLAPVHTVTL